jgi:hypothetical protein
MNSARLVRLRLELRRPLMETLRCASNEDTEHKLLARAGQWFSFIVMVAPQRSCPPALAAPAARINVKN